MNIKSFLLGSAAALVAVSGARAADAVVVAEPEPMEYVRICDTYGAGFYYIPGTETCLKIGGLFRYDIDANNLDDTFIPGTIDFDLGLAIVFDSPGDIDLGLVIVRDPEDDIVGVTVFGGDEGWQKSITARVNIDARSETELGTFRRFIRIAGTTTGVRSDRDGGGDDRINSLQDSADARIEYAYIELGGLLVGLYDTLYDGGMAPEFESGGGTAAHQIRYTFKSGAIMAQISLEEQDYNYDYTPNVVGRVGYTGGWGSIAAFAAYDSTTEEFGGKLLAAFNATDAILLEGIATYESGLGDFSVTGGLLRGYEYSLGAAISFKATDKFTIRAGGQYFGESHFAGTDEYRIGGQVDFQVVENLLLRGQVRYNGGDIQDYWDGKIRLEAAF